MAKSVTPGYKVVYPNRKKASSKLVKLLVALVLLASMALMLVVTIGGWSKLQGMVPLDIAWVLVYFVLAFYVFFKWSRGALTIASGLAILLLLVSLVAGLGLTGTSWFQRHSFGYASPQTPFGGQGLSASVLGTFTVLIAPVQALLIIVAMIGFSQSWNVETEEPVDDDNQGSRDGRGEGSGSSSPEAAAA